MSLQDRMHESMEELLRKDGLDVVSVHGYQDRTESDGYCETCYYEWAVVDIFYIDTASRMRTYTYSGSFGELIRELS